MEDKNFTSPLKVLAMTGSGTQNRICHLVLEPFTILEEYEIMRLEGHFFDIGQGIKAHKVVMGSLSEDLVPALSSIHGPILEKLHSVSFIRNKVNTCPVPSSLNCTLVSYFFGDFLYSRFLSQKRSIFSQI